MNKIFLGLQENNNEDYLLNSLKPEFNRICYNPVRASIIHLLVKSRDLNYCLAVEEIAHKIGKRHSVVIHHLEKLMEWGIVGVVKEYKYGSKKKRSIWGLNLKYSNLIKDLYSYMVKTFYTVEDLEEICNINKNVRME